MLSSLELSSLIGSSLFYTKRGDILGDANLSSSLDSAISRDEWRSSCFFFSLETKSAIIFNMLTLLVTMSALEGRVTSMYSERSSSKHLSKDCGRSFFGACSLEAAYGSRTKQYRREFTKLSLPSLNVFTGKFSELMRASITLKLAMIKNFYLIEPLLEPFSLRTF
jgi:hypothetical protein